MGGQSGSVALTWPDNQAEGFAALAETFVRTDGGVLPATPDRRALARDKTGLAEVHDLGAAAPVVQLRDPDRGWAPGGGADVLRFDLGIPGRETAVVKGPL